MDIKLHGAEDTPKDEIGYHYSIGYYGGETMEWRIAFYDEDTDMFYFDELDGPGRIDRRSVIYWANLPSDYPINEED